MALSLAAAAPALAAETNAPPKELTAGELIRFIGMCDASAAVAAGSNRMAVADDESSVLRIYDCRSGGAPLQSFDLTPYLRLRGRKPETDIEGGVRVGDLAYWIGSHGQNRSGKTRENRRIFFATRITEGPRGIAISLAGAPYKRLLEDLLGDPRYAAFNLGAAAQLPPKTPGALNIEGLCARPDGSFLVGFRNPIPQGRALFAVLQNPREMVLGLRARLGAPLQLDLEGRGVRDIVFAEGRYWIVGGPAGSQGASRLYAWNGDDTPPRRVHAEHFKKFNPEALLPMASDAGIEMTILSDDGALLQNGVPCKETPNLSMRSFRGFVLRGVLP